MKNWLEKANALARGYSTTWTHEGALTNLQIACGNRNTVADRIAKERCISCLQRGNFQLLRVPYIISHSHIGPSSWSKGLNSFLSHNSVAGQVVSQEGRGT